MIRRVLVGIDGGGGSTECLITSPEGDRIGYGTSGGSNIFSVGPEQAMKSLSDALAGAGLSQDDEVECACLGLSGVIPRGKNEKLWEIARAILPKARKIVIVNDSMIALVGAIGLGPGICVSSGTGSFGIGWDKNGKLAYSSGWGSLVGDEGSAYWIGCRALQSALRFYDHRAKFTALLKTILQVFHSDSMEDVAEKVNKVSNPREIISNLCPSVIQCAEEGDATALEIISEAGKELALTVYAIASQLNLVNTAVEVSAVGKAIEKSVLFSGAFTRALKQSLPGAIVISPRNTPVEGSILLAKKEAGEISIGKEEKPTNKN